MPKFLPIGSGVLGMFLCIASSAMADSSLGNTLSPVELVIQPPAASTASGVRIKYPVPPISTSRPSFTDASTTVPQDSLQVENGATYTDNRDGSRSWTLPETLVRFGLTPNTELRFISPNYINRRSHNNEQQVSNFGDMAIGLSHHRTLPGELDLALIPILNLPTGANNISANAVEPQLRLATSRQLTPKITIGGQFDVRWNNSKNSPATATFTPTFITSYQFTKRISGFLEYAGIVPTSGPTSQYLQTGLLYAPTKRQQLDVRLATGLNSHSPSILVGFGYSFRLAR